MKVRNLNSTGTFIVKNISKYYEISEKTFNEIYFPFLDIDWVGENKNADISIYSVQMNNEKILKSDEINIFYSIENLRHWGEKARHYKYYNKFKWIGSKKTNIFIHNDATKLIVGNNRLIIPTIYFRINYFNRIRTKFNYFTRFEKKKFCLFISKNNLNVNKMKILNELYKVGKLYNIKDFNIDNKSCYNSNEIVELFSQFKFIICFENSKTNGYITEKIFNVFLSKSIAIYDGAPDVNNYINQKSYIKYDNDTIKNVKMLMNNEQLYNQMMNKEKISENYNDENFMEIYRNRIMKK